MTCPNQSELGEKKLRKSSDTDDTAKEGPHSVGVWTLKIMITGIQLVIKTNLFEKGFSILSIEFICLILYPKPWYPT